jgi:hypothetical protein
MFFCAICLCSDPNTDRFQAKMTHFPFFSTIYCFLIFTRLKVKVKVTLEEATNAQTGSRGIVLLFL